MYIVYVNQVYYGQLLHIALEDLTEDTTHGQLDKQSMHNIMYNSYNICFLSSTRSW